MAAPRFLQGIHQHAQLSDFTINTPVVTRSGRHIVKPVNFKEITVRLKSKTIGKCATQRRTLCWTTSQTFTQICKKVVRIQNNQEACKNVYTQNVYTQNVITVTTVTFCMLVEWHVFLLPFLHIYVNRLAATNVMMDQLTRSVGRASSVVYFCITICILCSTLHCIALSCFSA